MPRKRTPKSTPTQETAAPVATRRILVLHGPNLNLFGTREPAHYGHQTLAEIDDALVQQGAASGVEVECFQSNAEHLLVERIHAAAQQGIGFIIINPAAYTHTSVAIRDALAGVAIQIGRAHV
jgi:3-dehydroquinate dehydratase-2